MSIYAYTYVWLSTSMCVGMHVDIYGKYIFTILYKVGLVYSSIAKQPSLRVSARRLKQEIHRPV
jgi:hypothetical protein